MGKLTDEGGEWMGWADGGRTVTWSFGPVYHRLALDKALPTPEPEAPKPADAGKKDGTKKDDEKAKDEKKKLPASQAIEIVLDLPRPRPSETVAYRGARIVTMKGDEVIENGTMVVAGNRIQAVGSNVAVPPGARTVDLAGRTIVPGFIDEHAHLHYSALDIFPQRPWKYAANLAYGVTTTHDPSASTHEAFGQSEMVEAGLMTGPRIYSTGFILYGADSAQRALIESLDDARKHVRRLKALGAFSVKSYMQPRREQRQWIIQAAREEGMLVVPEGGGDLEFDMSMILDGHTTIEHSLPQTPLYNDVVTLFSRSKTAYTPTLLVAYGGLSGDKWFHQHYELWKDERLQRVTPQAVVDSLGRIRNVMATDPADWHHVDVAAQARKVADAGGRVCLGGHGQMQGIGPHWEVWAFVQGGMPPLQALRVATRWPAEALGIDKDLGSLEAGQAGRLHGALAEPAGEDREQRDGRAGGQERHGLRSQGPGPRDGGGREVEARRPSCYSGRSMRARIALIPLLYAASACGGGGSSPMQPPPPTDSAGRDGGRGRFLRRERQRPAGAFRAGPRAGRRGRHRRAYGARGEADRARDRPRRARGQPCDLGDAGDTPPLLHGRHRPHGHGPPGPHAAGARAGDAAGNRLQPAERVHGVRRQRHAGRRRGGRRLPEPPGGQAAVALRGRLGREPWGRRDQQRRGRRARPAQPARHPSRPSRS